MDWADVARVLGISAIPFLELRLGIPFGMAEGLEPAAAIFFGILGNLVQVPLVFGLITLLRRLAQRFAPAARLSAYMDRLAERRTDSVKKYGWLGISLLVGVPIPGTGLWTGAVVASLARLPLSTSLIALALGVVISGLLVGALSAGAVEALDAVR